VIKRGFDILMATAGLLLFAPLMLTVAILIKLQDRGKVLYRGARIGRFGKPFGLLKFRTMVTNADKLGGTFTSAEDHRITRFGRVLRRYKIDELPQLINVLRGEMSIVGPRPETLQYVNSLASDEARVILSARPGLTDWATLWNHDEEDFLKGKGDPEKASMAYVWPIKSRLQLEYVRKRTFALDIHIILLTLWTIVRRGQPNSLRENPAALSKRLGAEWGANQFSGPR
jgi:lipopolysaccharide/colanic/teichoic acid biosynthesis glycosyltransferase